MCSQYVCLGVVDSAGEFTGDSIAYLYPDLTTALLGRFQAGVMVSAKPARLEKVDIARLFRWGERLLEWESHMVNVPETRTGGPDVLPELWNKYFLSPANPCKKSFLAEKMNWIDFLAVAPYYLALLLEELKDMQIIGKAGKLVRLLRLLRILRIFKMVRHFVGLQSLVNRFGEFF